VTEGRGVPLVYVATRLFALQDRIAAAILADQISVALAKSGLDEASVFLPFRDTGQSGISSSNKARSIYEADRARLDAACLVIGLVDGMAKDDGVARNSVTLTAKASRLCWRPATSRYNAMGREHSIAIP